MTNVLSRRDFLKLGGAAAGVIALGEFIPPLVAKAAGRSGQLDANGNGTLASICEMCVWRCGILAKVRNGRVVKLDGNPDHPHSKGKLCPRGQAGIMNTYDPDRVLTPLIRVGKRGEGQFRKASWDEALDLVSAKMLAIKEKYGPEAMVFSSTHNLSQPLFENFLQAFGSPNYGTQRSLCFNAMTVSNLMTYGMEEPDREYSEVKYIILTGRNLAEAISNSETGDLSNAIDRGVKVIYLDPRFTKTAAKATEWLPIRPGTDLAFHLALLHVIIGEGLYDHSFVSQYTLGFEEVAGSVGRYTPEWAADITGIPADTIRRIAHEFAGAGRHALAHNGWRTSNFVNSFQTERAIGVLNALVGNWGTTLFPAGSESGELGAPVQPAYPRVSALRLDGVAWKYPFVPLKFGVIQQMRELDRGRRPLRRARLVHLAPEPGHVHPGSPEDDAGPRQDGLHCHDGHPHERYGLVLRCGSAGSFVLGALRPAFRGWQPRLHSTAGHRTARRRQIGAVGIQATGTAFGNRRFLPICG